jgi:hypothetical protein
VNRDPTEHGDYGHAVLDVIQSLMSFEPRSST